MNLHTISSRAAGSVVAGVAGYSSYLHIVHVAQRAGEDGAVPFLLPFAIDGLIVVGTMAMLDDKRNRRKPRLSARVAVGFGVVATLAANVASAAPTWTARAVAVVPAIAFVIAVEVLSRVGRKLPAEVPAEATTSVTEVVAPQGNDRVRSVDVELPAEEVTSVTAVTGRPSGAGEIAGTVELPEVRPARAPRKVAAKPVKTTPRRPAEETRKLAEQVLASAPEMPRKAVAEQLEITPRRLRQVLNEDTGERPVNGVDVLAGQSA